MREAPRRGTLLAWHLHPAVEPRPRRTSKVSAHPAPAGRPMSAPSSPTACGLTPGCSSSVCGQSSGSFSRRPPIGGLLEKLPLDCPQTLDEHPGVRPHAVGLLGALIGRPAGAGCAETFDVRRGLGSTAGWRCHASSVPRRGASRIRRSCLWPAENYAPHKTWCAWFVTLGR